MERHAFEACGWHVLRPRIRADFGRFASIHIPPSWASGGQPKGHKVARVDLTICDSVFAFGLHPRIGRGAL